MSHRNPHVIEITDRLGPALSAELVRRLRASGHPDFRLAHGKVFEHLGDGARLTTLAERAQMTKQSMSELVATLERLGYVERMPDPADGRAKLVVPTARGIEVMKFSRRAIHELHELARTTMGAERVDQLELLLADYERAFYEWRAPRPRS